KIGEAEVMAEHGLDDIFIANEPVGAIKMERLRALAEKISVSWGIDCPEHVEAAEKAFSGCAQKAEVLVEIEVGENRSGIIEEADFLALLAALKKAPHVHLKGVFSHDGNSYSVPSLDACRESFVASQERTLRFAELARENGFGCGTVSIGSTPSLMHDFPILPGITEFRPGTYILMDASMAAACGAPDRCAATVLATVISRPTPERVILDVGAKGITMQRRTKGITANPGLGTIKGWDGVYIHAVYDEHAIIYSKAFRDGVRIGDKVEIIPVHICPTVNLQETAYLVSRGEVVEEIPVLCRGKLK
ncbi:MAG: alanine racemase, partial [Pyramidobacter sp.]|nr:alanine racemase [Pyramidobacter sp.]